MALAAAENSPRVVLRGAVVQVPSLGLARVGREREAGRHDEGPTTQFVAQFHARTFTSRGTLTNTQVNPCQRGRKGFEKVPTVLRQSNFFPLAPTMRHLAPQSGTRAKFSLTSPLNTRSFTHIRSVAHQQLRGTARDVNSGHAWRPAAPKSLHSPGSEPPQFGLVIRRPQYSPARR